MAMFFLLATLPALILVVVRTQGHRLEKRARLISLWYCVIWVLIMPEIVKLAQWRGAIECWATGLLLMLPVMLSLCLFVQKRLPKQPTDVAQK